MTHDRNLDTNEKAINQIQKTGALGTVTVQIPRDSRRGIAAREAEMEVAFCRVNIMKPQNLNDDKLPPKLPINLVRITEINPPEGQTPIEWILATSLVIGSADDAFKIVQYYVQRWKIERFHYVLKSGCNAEKIQQRTYERIKPVLLIYSVIALFIMAVTYMGRVLPDVPCSLFFDEDEWKILYRIANKTKVAPEKPYSMSDAVKYLGQLGSYKRAPSDGPPGLKSIWIGLVMLFVAMDLFLGQV